MWQNGYVTDKIKLKERLRICWYVLTKGKQPYSDMLIFENDKVQKIAEFLKDIK
jgi:hypothetical protein